MESVRQAHSGEGSVSIVETSVVTDDTRIISNLKARCVEQVGAEMAATGQELLEDWMKEF